MAFSRLDGEAINYLRLTGRDDDRVALVEAYAKAQGMWRGSNAADPQFTDTLSLDLGAVVPSLAGQNALKIELPYLMSPLPFASTLADSTGRSAPKSVAISDKGDKSLMVM